jgi:putative transposase
MKKTIQKERPVADRLFTKGENQAVTCASIGKSRQRQNKRVARHTNDNPGLCESRSWQTFSNPQRTDAEIKEIVAMVRLSLYNKSLPCGNRAIQCELEEMAVQPVPSLSTISRILCRRDLTHCRTGRYEADEEDNLRVWS